MKLFSLGNDNKSASLNFQKKPSPAQIKHYERAINDGLKVLNKDIGIIIHNSSVPAKAGKNIGIGSLLSKATESFFVPFLKTQGFTSIQQEPTYLRRNQDFSPYDPISTSKNIFMIPLEKLASEEYNLINPNDEILNKIYSNGNPEKVDYKKTASRFNIVLKEAYKNFKQKDANSELVKEFEQFKLEKGEDLEPNAIYEVLSIKNFTEDWRKWTDADKNLYKSKNSRNTINTIKTVHKDLIDFHIFKQWLIEREISATNARNNKAGIKIIADTPVAFAPAEVWRHQDLFLKDLSLGCPPDYYSSNGQRWGFPVMDPEKLFNKDGSLGKGGKFLMKRYEEIFKASPGGVRIDHLIGLIDPFVYVESEPKMNQNNSGRLYSSPSKELFKNYVRYNDEQYGSILEKIIFPAAAKFGITKDKIICEDLGEQTPPVQRIINKLNLTGLSVTQYGYSGYDAPEKNVIMLGAHDNKSYIEYTDELFAKSANLGEGRDRFMFRTHILGSDTSVPKEDVNLYREQIRSDKTKFMMASFAELFTSPAKKVQIFFTDFFGIGKTYNVPGTKKDCWTLRLTPNYEDLYYKNLTKGTAINLPEVIARAIRQKGEDFSSQHTELLRKLDFFTNILKR